MVWRRARVPALFAGVLLTLVLWATPAAAKGLGGVDRLALSVDLDHPVGDAHAGELGRRLAAFLAELQPPVAIDAASPDRLRLTVAVRPHSSTALRGFWLPFSGTYGIGTVRLSLERAVHLPGHAPRTIPAIVWQRERLVAAAWSAAGAAIAGAVGELLDDFRRAVVARP